MLYEVTPTIIVDPEDVSSIRVLHERLIINMKTSAPLEAEFSYHPDAENAASELRKFVNKNGPHQRQNPGDKCLLCDKAIPEFKDGGCGNSRRKGEWCPADTELPF